MLLNILIMFRFLFLFTSHTSDVPKSIYDFKVEALDGKTINFEQYKGKKILIVNTTSVNGTNPQYAELEAIYEQYKGKLVIIGFLDEDFGHAPGSKKDIETFERKNYGVTFPLAAKVLVKGNDRSPVYKWLTEKKYNNLMDSEVKWDFQKYLVNEKGELVAVFDPKVRANSPQVISAIEK